jgi:hypothetical protein
MLEDDELRSGLFYFSPAGENWYQEQQYLVFRTSASKTEMLDVR